jgi:hypothetical protein
MSTQPQLQILSVERIDGTEAILEFSDGTYAVYTTDDLIRCAKERRPVQERNSNHDK